MSKDDLCLDLLQEVIGLCCTIGLLVLIGLCTIVCSTEAFHRLLVHFPVFLRIRDACEFASCSWTGCGKVLRTIWSVFSIASFFFFIGHTIEHPRQIVFQKTAVDNILVYIDLGLNVFFIIFFIIRFIGANDKWGFIVSSSTWMEVLTIGPAITAVLGTRKQLMFGFLRALRLAGLKDLVFVVGIVKRYQLKTLTNILANVLCFWCVFAGIIYQTENLTAFTTLRGWKICSDSTEGLTGEIDFFRSMYFLLVTASSVGYGDITPSNYATKSAIICFVVIAVTFFASIIPVVYAMCSVPQNFGNRSFYTGAGEKHVLYCGSSQLNMLKSFFWNFYHNDGKHSNDILRVCFLQSRQLSEQITWFLRSFCGRITVVFGSPSDSECLLDSCKLKRTEAVILTSEAGMRSDFEADRLNYVRTIGLKLCAPQCRTIVQVKSMFHKQSFRALPLWRTRQESPGALPPDAVLCDNQVLLGLMGVNSVAPGFATLLINLLSYRESKAPLQDSGSWRAAYIEGIQAKLYCVGFNARHRDRSFKAVALDAYMACGALLIGVRMVDKLTGILTGVINPSFDASFTINPSTMKAFLISRDPDSALKFASCTTTTTTTATTVSGGVCIHGDIGVDSKTAADRRAFEARKDPLSELGEPRIARQEEADGFIAAGISCDLSEEFDWQHSGPADETQRTGSNAEEPPAAGTQAPGGHQAERRLEDWFQAHIDGKAASPRELHAAEHEVPPLEDITGTLHWAPNRPCRTLSVADAKTIEFRRHVVIVVIGSLDHPLGLSSFVLPLRNYSIPAGRLSDIVILGDAGSIEQHEWRGIKNFPFVYVVDGSGVCPQHLLYCRAHRAAAMVVINLRDRCSGLDPFLEDKMTLQCTENLRGLGAMDCHVTSELFYSPNAYCFSDPTERLADISASDVMDTQSFAEGLVVSSPNLTGLLASVYFCPESLAFLESIVYGSNQPSVDDYLSLDFCIPSALSRGLTGDRSRVFNFRVLQLGASDPPLCDLFRLFDCKEMKWEDLLIGCLDKFDIMCLGIYRRRTVKKKKTNAKTIGGWFVLTFPDPGTQIDQKDKIFCFAPPPKREKQGD